MIPTILLILGTQAIDQDPRALSLDPRLPSPWDGASEQEIHGGAFRKLKVGDDLFLAEHDRMGNLFTIADKTADSLKKDVESVEKSLATACRR